MEFKDRLIEYRNELGIDTQGKMAELIGISRQLYSSLESGYKSPSKAVLEKLKNHSNLPEEYWLYGVGADNYITERKEFKCLYTMLEELKDTDYLDLRKGDWSPEVKDMLISALKADVTHMLLKNKKDS